MFRLDRQRYADKTKEEILDELEKTYNKLEQSDDEKDKEIERLKKELRKYKNSNTPPSANQHLKPDIKPKNSNRKRGAPFNHIGFTRARKEADETLHITSCNCPKCNGTRLKLVRKKRRQIEDAPTKIQFKVVNVERDELECEDCGHRFTARDGKTPLRGRFGLNLIVLTVFLKFIVRGVLRKTASFLETGFGLRMAPATVNAIITRAANAAQGEYDALKQRIRTTQIVYVDETSFSVMGTRWWAWVFRTKTDILLVVRHSRGNNVLEEILGKSFSGIVICDGLWTYNYLVNASIQRCWAHLLRKARELTKSSKIRTATLEGKHFHHELTLLFKRIKRFNAKPRTTEQRSRKHEQLALVLKKMVDCYSGYPECKAVVKYVNFRLGEWLTCVRLEGVEPTNNFAEQAIRETVIVRKIVGAFRSLSGPKVYEKLASMIATWRIQKLDVSGELYRMLSTNLC